MSTPFDHLQYEIPADEKGRRESWEIASLERAPRVRRMLELLPLVLQNGRNIRELFTIIAGELGALEEATTRLMRSKWHRLALGYPDDTDTKKDALLIKADSELGRYAALFGISPARGESSAYLRQHIEAMAEIHRSGISTAPAILRLVSLLYQGDQPPNIHWIERDNKFIATWEFNVPDKADPNAAPKTYRIELIDNPAIPAKAEFRSTTSGQQCVVTNRCLDGHLNQTLPEKIVLKAVEADIHVPIITFGDSIARIAFIGTIPKGQALVLRPRQPSLVGEKEIAGRDMFQLSAITTFDKETTRLDDPDPTRFAAFETLDSFEALGVGGDLPRLPGGNSVWSWDTLDRAELEEFLAGWFATNNVDATKRQALLQRAPVVQPTDQRADFELHWQEVAPATFELRIPKDYLPPHYEQPADQSDPRKWGVTALMRDIERVLAFGRAAGVHSRLELVPNG